MPHEQALAETSLRYPGWRVVAACFFVALFCWGFALYGHGVYLTELSRLRGWPTSLISFGVTCFYLLIATLVIFISDAIARFGPKRVMLLGTCCFGIGVTLLAFIDALWQLYPVYLLMAFGAAAMHVGAISTVVGLWFDRQRGLALSLALNGASTGGVLITPILVLAIDRFGFTEAIVGSMILMAAVLLPAIAFWIDRPARAGHAAGAATAGTWTRYRALRSLHFWSVAGPFAMALTAQVGFLVHQIAFLEPKIGRATAGLSVAAITVAAIVGRFVLGALANRLDMRLFTAMSVASQTVALVAMVWLSDTPSLIAACLLFGLSAGNLITLPSLVIQREFEAASFGMLVGLSWAISQFTYSFGPGVMGVIRDSSGSYTAPVLLCAALNLAAGVLILLRPSRRR